MTTENVTSAFANGSDDLVEGATDLAAIVPADANATADVAITASVASESRSSDSTPAATAPTGGDDRTGNAASQVTAAASPGTPSRTSGSGAMAAPSERADESPGSTPDPTGSGAALGGALVVAGVTAAGASKQIAAVAPAAQGQELTWFGRALRAKVGATTEMARSKLARLPRIVFPPGYSRHDDSDPLEHDVRRSLFETVERSPGANLTSLADGADVSMSTVRHHLRILEAENLLVGERIRGQRRYFLSNESEPALVAALDDAATEPILRALARAGPASVSDLADRLGRDPSTITHHLSRLEDDGLVERERDGRSVQNELAPVAERVLDRSAASQRRRPVATE